MAFNIGIIAGAVIPLNDSIRYRLTKDFWEAKISQLKGSSKAFTSMYGPVQETIRFQVVGTTPAQIQKNINYISSSLLAVEDIFDRGIRNITPLFYVDPSGIGGAGASSSNTMYYSRLYSAELNLPANWVYQVREIGKAFDCSLTIVRDGFLQQSNAYTDYQYRGHSTLSGFINSTRYAALAPIVIENLAHGSGPTPTAIVLGFMPSGVTQPEFSGFIINYNAAYSETRSVLGSTSFSGVSSIADGTAPGGTIRRISATGLNATSFFSQSNLLASSTILVESANALAPKIQRVSIFCPFRVISGVWSTKVVGYQADTFKILGETSPVILDTISAIPKYSFLGELGLSEKSSSLYIDTQLTPLTANAVIEMGLTTCITNANITSIFVEKPPSITISGATSPLERALLYVGSNLSGQDTESSIERYPESNYNSPSVGVSLFTMGNKNQFLYSDALKYYALPYFGDANFYSFNPLSVVPSSNILNNQAVAVLPLFTGGHVSSGWAYTVRNGGSFSLATYIADIATIPTYAMLPEL